MDITYMVDDGDSNNDHDDGAIQRKSERDSNERYAATSYRIPCSLSPLASARAKHLII